MVEIVCKRCGKDKVMEKDSWVEDGTGCSGYTCPECGFHIYESPIVSDLHQYEQMGSIKVVK